MNKLTAFAFGAAIGCAAGTLAAIALTPRNGDEMRKLATEKAGELSEDVMNFNAGVAYYRDCALKEVKAKGEELVKNLKGEEPMSEGELKAKIAEARERIAARMAEENAGAGQKDGE